MGCVVVTVGVVLHLPMYWMGRDMGFQLAGMAMDAGMVWGMVAIVVGIGLGQLFPAVFQHIAALEFAQVNVPVGAPEGSAAESHGHMHN